MMDSGMKNINQPNSLVWIVVTIVAATISGASVPFLEGFLAKNGGSDTSPPHSPENKVAIKAIRETQVYPDSSRYEGETKDGIREGIGTYFGVNGDKYTGEWRNDMRHGVGSYTWSNGDLYRGEWRNNLKHGRGVFTGYDGLEKRGIWENDRLVKEVP
ncbi:MAG: hypothetical protein F6J93_05265 [Oscillatoria sp. SIO1A7]|nr:hypothetical protein [Oscillatoria sp. SIO1A7]